MKRVVVGLILALASSGALAQWQVPSGTIPIGRGPGVIGFNSTAPSTTGTKCFLDTVPPSFGACGGTALVNTEIFVSPLGSDANSGKSWFAPKLTLQAGVDAATGGGRVSVTAGAYTLTSKLNMRALVALECSLGVTITQGTAANLASLIDFNANTANSATIRNCLIDGNNANNTNQSNGGGQGACVQIGAASDVIVDNNTIRNCPYSGVLASAGARPIITNNKIDNVNVDGIGLVASSANTAFYGRIAKNIITNVNYHCIELVWADYNLLEGNTCIGSIFGSNVTVSGTAVTWVSGTNFAGARAGSFLVVNSGAECWIASVNSSTSITLNSGAGCAGTNVYGVIGSGDLYSINSSSYNRSIDNYGELTITGIFVLSNVTGTESAVGNSYVGNTAKSAGSAPYDIESLANGTTVSDTHYSGNVAINAGQGLGANTGTFNNCFNLSGAQINNVLLDSSTCIDTSGVPLTQYWLSITLATGVIVGDYQSIGPANGNTILGTPSSIVGQTARANTWSAVQTLASPVFTGTPTAPTAAAGTNTTQVATTAGIVAERSAAKTLTNTTYDTAGAGNSFSINSLAATANTGTGSVVRATSPTIASPTFTGTASGNATIPNAMLVTDSTTAWSAYTPTTSCNAGTITTETKSFRTKTIGKTTYIQGSHTITTVGTCTGTITYSLPNTANNNGAISAANAGAGSLVVALLTAASSNFQLFGTPTATTYYYTIVYENQ